MKVLWTFSIILESVCVLPQLLLLRQTTVPTVIDSFYLVTLGSYRALYILNWILRAVQEHHFDPVAVIFGVIQTALYVDFAWVYWTRQRVKLRNGGVVDSEDLSRGWLVSRLLGKDRDSFDEAEWTSQGRSQGEPPKRRGKWGARGVSVSADDGILAEDQAQRTHVQSGHPVALDDQSAHLIKGNLGEDARKDISSPQSKARDMNEEIR